MFEYSFGCENEKSNSLGFIELLNMQDFGPSVFDLLDQNPTVQIRETSEVLNAPATPNYSSISSESSELANKEPQERDEDDDNEHEDDEREVKEEVHHKTKKELKVKKTNQKKEREARFAFMTKSEVDHLEDGYRWRKYGQKAVKNSPFPRSYYRCTNATCNVKKRVERSCNDPTIVVTTYEGQHTHASPKMPRPTGVLPPPYHGFSAGAAGAQPQLGQNHMILTQAQLMNFGAPTNGLLQDMVPNWSTIKKEGQ